MSDGARKSLRDIIYAEIEAAATDNALDAFTHSTPIDAHTRKWYTEWTEYTLDFFEEVGLAIGAAGLVHDLGHPPFSHTLESLYERHFRHIVTNDGFGDTEQLADEVAYADAHFAFHELVGLKLTRRLLDASVGKVSWWLVENILRSSELGTWSFALHQIIAAEVDVDRIDYLVRDARLAGIEFGAIDQVRLFESMEMHTSPSSALPGGLGWRIGFGYRARTAIETFLTNRIRYYQWVLFHHHVVAKNKFLEEAVEELLWLTEQEGETKADSGLHRTLASKRPSLDFFSFKAAAPIGLQNGTTVSDSNILARASEINDATIIAWMQDSASIVRGALESASWGPELTRRLRRYSLLYHAALLRTPNWYPAWKTEDHFAHIAEQLKVDILRVVGSIESSLAPPVAHEDDSADAVLEVRSLNVRMRGILAKLRSEAEIGAPQLLNAVAALLFDRADAVNAKDAERQFVNYLNGHSVEVPFTAAGVWVASYQSTTAVRDPAKGGVAIYRYQVWEAIAQLSASVNSLNASYSAYPKLFVYYVSDSPEIIGEGGTDLKEAQVAQMRKIFRKAFITLCEHHLEVAIRSSRPI